MTEPVQKARDLDEDIELIGTRHGQVTHIVDGTADTKGYLPDMSKALCGRTIWQEASDLNLGRRRLCRNCKKRFKEWEEDGEDA